MKFFETLAHVYRLSFITRFPNRYRIRDENVAQHSFFVSVIVMLLHEEYDFELGAALQAAVSHDIVEADLGDTPHSVKQRHVDVTNELDRAEQKELQKYPIGIIQGVELFNSWDVEGLVCRLADVLQVSQYISAEESLGNTTLHSVSTEIRHRIDALRGRLQQYERKNK